MNKNKIKFNGFTLIEILVSIFIISMISVISIASFKSYKRSSDVYSDALKLSSDLRKAQNYSLALKNFGSTGFPAGGWGIFIDNVNGEYTIFSDNNNDKEYQTNEKFYTYATENAIINNSTFTNTAGASSDESRAYITFEPPDPKINICKSGSDCNYKSLVVELKGKNSGENSFVRINNLGLVEASH